MMHTLEVKNLKKSYDGKEVLRDVSLHINSGEVVGLLGPNGAGKTTTFHIILGLINADSGGVSLDGESLSNSPMYKRARKGIGYLPQESSIFRKLSVEDNIMAFLEIVYEKSEREEKLKNILEEFKFTPLAKRLGHQLSGGERRRVEIARVLTLNPLFILLDEPFTLIDPITVIELKKTIVELKEKGIGLIITDHNVRDTLSITDRAYIINMGSILAHGSPEDLVCDEGVKRNYLGEDFKL